MSAKKSRSSWMDEWYEEKKYDRLSFRVLTYILICCVMGFIFTTSEAEHSQPLLASFEISATLWLFLKYSVGTMIFGAGLAMVFKNHEARVSPRHQSNGD